MKKFEITKEQILKLNSYNNYDCGLALKQWFPQAFEAELEVGKWYKSTDNDGFMFYITKIDENIKGYGILEVGGDFHEKWSMHKNSCYGNRMILATDKEVETALIEEAKRRGFENGVKFYGCEGAEKNIPIEIDSIEVVYYFVKNGIRGLYCSGSWIFFEGKWATIINEPLTLTLEQIAEKFGTTADNIKICK